jgi:PAS domain S-box-containing protein
VENSLKILMLEDNKADAELIRYELRKGDIDFSYELVETESEFRNALESFQPDIILSDYELPTFDGISALNVVHSTLPDVPFIFVTGVMGEETAIEMLRNGATDYVLKHRLSRLVPAVSRALEEVDERESRRLAEEALRQSEERYRTIFESTGTANCIIERDAGITHVNHEFERLSQFSAAELRAGGSFVEMLSMSDEGAEDFRRRHQALIEARRHTPVRFVGMINDRSGDAHNVIVSMGLLRNSDSVVVSLIDITRETEYEDELKERAARLAHFLMVASHELRHPITLIKGYATTLEESGEQMPTGMVSDIYKSMDGAADRLTRTVERLIDISVIDNQELTVEKRELEIEPLCAAAVERIHARGFGNDVRTTIKDDAYGAEVDRDVFIELLYLILENACLYSDPSSPVEIEVRRGDGAVQVSVLDRGPGIKEEDLGRVFDRFYQVDDVMHHSQPGLGLGLYIAKEIVTAHGGRIWCERREDGGSAFRFTIA